MNTIGKRAVALTLYLSLGMLLFSTSQALAEKAPSPDKSTDRKISGEDNSIPIRGAITHVREPDGSSNAMVDIVIGDEFSGTLPDDIDTITVAAPKGDLSIGKEDFHFYPQFRDFWIRIPGAPQIGTYTFSVTSGSRRGSTTDTQSDIRLLPIPDSKTFRPVQDKKITRICYYKNSI